MSGVAAALTWTACAPAHPPGSATPVRRTLNLAGAEPASLNPIFSTAIGQNNLLRLMFDPLIASDAEGNPVPDLAAVVPTLANGGISADGLTITYHLRHDVRWHDGAPFTSRDVVFSTHAMLDPNNPLVSRRGYDQIRSVAAPDSYTVRVRLRAPFAPFVTTYFSESDFPIYPVPAHLLAGTPNLARAAFSSAPVGTGPFRFVRWERGDKIEMRANRTYFRGAPKLDGLTWHIEATENTMLAQLRSGDLDMVMDLSPVAAAQLAGTAGVGIVASPVNGYLGIMFNTGRVDRPLRRAIALAIDAAAVRGQIGHGFDRPAVADLPSFLWAFAPQVRPLRYDPAAARALLAAAGYSPQHPLSLDLAIISGRRTDEALAVLLQATLLREGIAVRIRPYAPSLYGATSGERGILAGGRYDATVYYWIAGMDPDDSSQFLCDQRPPAGNNVAFYCDPQMDAAQRRALETYARPERKRAYATIEALLVRDVPIVFIGSPTDPTALRLDISGFSPNPVTPSARSERWAIGTRGQTAPR